MNRFMSYYLYFKNIIYLFCVKIVCDGKLKARKKQLIGKYSDITIRKKGQVEIGNKLYTRSNFHMLVEGGKCTIGDNCFFNHNCSITCLDKIEIGNRCTFGNNLVLVDHDHDFRNKKNDFLCRSVSIGDGAWIGANVTIIKGVTIGCNSVIAAGSVVTKNVPDNCMWINGKVEHIERG